MLQDVDLNDKLTNDNREENALQLLESSYELRIILNGYKTLKDKMFNDKILHIFECYELKPENLYMITLSCNHPFINTLLGGFVCALTYRLSGEVINCTCFDFSKNKTMILLNIILQRPELLEWRSSWKKVSKELAEWKW